MFRQAVEESIQNHVEERYKLDLGLEYLVKNEAHNNLLIHIRKKNIKKNLKGQTSFGQVTSDWNELPAHSGR